jgi:long-chain acyl-CoA synthetase
VDDIGALRPTIFIGVPRVFDRIYSGVLSKIQVEYVPEAHACPCMPASKGSNLCMTQVCPCQAAAARAGGRWSEGVPVQLGLQAQAALHRAGPPPAHCEPMLADAQLFLCVLSQCICYAVVRMQTR